MSLQSWAERYAAVEGGTSNWGDRPWRYVFSVRMSQIGADHVTLAPKAWDQVMWNAASDGGEIAWDESEPLTWRLDLLDTLAKLLVTIEPALRPNSSALFMFWDVFISKRRRATIVSDRIFLKLPPNTQALFRRIESGLPKRSDEPAVADRVFFLLREQLLLGGKQFEKSALHGLNHLEDPETMALIRERRPYLADDEVRSFADSAARFALP